MSIAQKMKIFFTRKGSKLASNKDQKDLSAKMEEAENVIDNVQDGKKNVAEQPSDRKKTTWQWLKKHIFTDRAITIASVALGMGLYVGLFTLSLTVSLYFLIPFVVYGLSVLGYYIYADHKKLREKQALRRKFYGL